MMQLTVHFSLEEMVRSSTAVRLGIDNTPPQEVVERLKVTAEGLEKVRKIILLHDTPLTITSGYRCLKLNEAKGSKPTSAHIQGWAADFVSKIASPKEIVQAIEASDLEFDQVIWEGDWVHLSFDPRMRRQVLTATFIGGKAVYSNGV